ncbi:hypothetical protein BDR22DRAFT_972029 [Usnea florida]
MSRCNLTPPDPAVVPQIDRDASRLLRNAIDDGPPQGFQPSCQSHAGTTNSAGTAPSTLSKSIATQPKSQECSPPKESGVTMGSTTEISNSIGERRSTIEGLVKQIKNTKIPRYKQQAPFHESGYTKFEVSQRRKNQSPTEVIIDIVIGFANAMSRGSWGCRTKNQFMFFCLCKVLAAIGVDIKRLENFVRSRGFESLLEDYFSGVVWANRLLQELSKMGWGNQAVDLLLSWNLTTEDFGNFDQHEISPGPTPVETPNYHKDLVNFLKDPEYIANSTTRGESKKTSLPARVGKILLGIVSDRDICEALHHKDVCVKEAPKWQEYEYGAKLVWSAPHDHGDISSICICLNYSSTVTKCMDSSGQAQSSSNARELDYMNITDILAKYAFKCPKKPAVKKRVRNAKQVSGYFPNSSSGSNMSKHTASIKSSHQAQSYWNVRDQAVTDGSAMLVDSASTAPKLSASQNSEGSLPHHPGYLFPPQCSCSDFANSTGSDNSSRQSQGLNEFDMLVDSAPTTPKVPGVKNLKRILPNDTGYLFPPYSSCLDTTNSTRSDNSSRQAQDHAPINDFDMLGDSAPTAPKLSALQNLKRRLLYDTGYVPSPYSSYSDIANSTGSNISSRQAQGHSIAPDYAPINDFHMLGDSATTGTNPKAGEGLDWTTGNIVSEMARKNWDQGGRALADNAWEATQSTWKANQSGWEVTQSTCGGTWSVGKADQSAWQAENVASVNYCDPWPAQAQCKPETYVGRNIYNYPCDSWYGN